MSKKLFLFSLCLLLTTSMYAQTAGNEIEMADLLYESGKIYVVVVSLAVILLGIIIYLFVVDRKIANLKKRLDRE